MKKIMLVGLISIGWADTFYVLNNEENVTLEIIHNKTEVETHLLESNGEFHIAEYQKICLKNIKTDVEVGIKENQDITLKKDFLCHNFRIFPETIPESTFLTKLIFRIDLLKDIITYSGKKELIALAGKGAEAVKVSKSKYPNLELDFSDINEHSVVKIYKNKKPVKNSDKNTFSFKNLMIKDSVIIKVLKNSEVLYSQKFVIVK